MKNYWMKNKFFFLLAALLCTITALLSAFISIILQKVTDVAIAGQLEVFWKILLFATGYIMILCLVNFLSSLATKLLIQRMTKQMRSDIFENVMKKSPVNFHKANTADYISALINDVKLVEDNYLLPIMANIEVIVMFIATLTLLLFLSPVVTAVLILSLVFIFVVPLLLGRALQKRQERVSQQLARFTEKMKDIFSGFDVIRSYRLFPFIKRQFETENKNTADVRFSADKLVALNSGLSDTLSSLSVIVVIFTSAYLVIRGAITVGTLMALLQLSGTFLGPVLMLMENLPKIKSMKPVIQKLNSIPEPEDGILYTGVHPTFNRCISFRNVSFSYTGENLVLDNISLDFQKGKKYAIVGHSGCGKSTLVRLMTGYSPHYQGRIYYDSNELRQICTDELGDLVSLLHQSIYLFNSTVGENISLFRTFDDAAWKNAVEKSGVSRFLPQLEQGLQSSVGENGSKLSGGQRQRVALARAFIRDTDTVILDEGTSAIDSQTAADIEATLLAEDNLTLITITHALNEPLLRQYDQILFMEQGHIAAAGRFEELIADNQKFSEFCGTP